ncbi:hypothetical protein QZH41_001466 [Actinostola sp. cb2023]|nr:hypothetical protein QZH41_001466 [Actinostola sp. cb2023]
MGYTNSRLRLEFVNPIQTDRSLILYIIPTFTTVRVQPSDKIEAYDSCIFYMNAVTDPIELDEEDPTVNFKAFGTSNPVTLLKMTNLSLRQELGRVNDYIKTGLDSKYLHDPDGGINLLRKKAEFGVLEKAEPDLPQSFPKEGFKSDLMGIPKVTFGTVWRYMIDGVDIMPRVTRVTRRGRSAAPRADATEVSAGDVLQPVTTNLEPGTVSVNVAALSATISTAVSQAVQAAMSKQPGLGNGQNPAPSQMVGEAVDDEVADIRGAGIQSPDETTPHQLFTSIAVSLGSRVSARLKAKIWAEEYVDFGALLSIPPQSEKYSLSLARPSGSSLCTPQLTLEPCHQPKKVTTIDQWITAFHTYVSIYSEKFSSQTSRLMKYCETVRDLAQKPGDWYYYDEQFRYLRQSGPDRYPWDQIHWELWLGAVTNFRRQVQRANARRGRVRDANSREPSAGELVSNLDALLRSALSEGSRRSDDDSGEAAVVQGSVAAVLGNLSAT